jgi:hypothetical protein
LGVYSGYPEKLTDHSEEESLSREYKLSFEPGLPLGRCGTAGTQLERV